MISPPTPQQHALIAQMLQAHIQQPPMNPAPGAGGGHYLPIVPDPDAHGDWSYTQPWIPIPSQGYNIRSGHGYGGAMNSEDPSSVFGAMRQALPGSTKSNLHSHQQALIQRFMRNQRGKVRAS
jgi:hypothetical protein